MSAARPTRETAAPCTAYYSSARSSPSHGS